MDRVLVKPPHSTKVPIFGIVTACHSEDHLGQLGVQPSTGRAGFTLSGALFRKKCGALYLEKTGDLFCS